MEQVVLERTAEVVKQKDALAAQAEILTLTNGKLVELDSFKQTLMGMIVHDLKNPLNVILNVIESHSLPSQVAILRQSARQMLTMVLNILDVQKFEDTKMALDKHDCSLLNLTEQAVAQVRFLSDRKNIALNNQIAPDLAVRVDVEMIERVLVNLLTNAIKYTPNNGQITLATNPKGFEKPLGFSLEDFVRIEVRDNGEGIPADKLSNVFDKFGQIKAKSSGNVRSTGIGLTFCKLAVEGHGGRIGVESEVGVGTTFWFTLPGATIGTQLAMPVVASPDVSGAAGSVAALSEADKKLLRPFAQELRAIKIYQFSDLRRILKRADFPTNAQIDLWKKRLESAIAAENQELFEELLNL